MLSIRFWTLLKRELMRIKKIAGQTILSPVIESALYFIVFGISLGRRIEDIQGIPYLAFIIPGLIMMSLINSSYSNSGYSLFIMKIQQNITDILVAPFTYSEIIFAYTVSSVIRSSTIGVIIWITSLFFMPAQISHPMIALLFILLVAICFAIIGIMVAIVSEEFEQISLLPTFLLTPLSFLGGVFYSINMLPPLFQKISLFNPLVYMINGLRYGFYGISDVNPFLSLAVISLFAFVLYIACYQMLVSGYKLRQ